MSTSQWISYIVFIWRAKSSQYLCLVWLILGIYAKSCFCTTCVYYTNIILIVDRVSGYCSPPISNDFISGESYLSSFWHNSIVITSQRPTEFFFMFLCCTSSISVSCYFNLPTNCKKKKKKKNDSFLFLRNGSWVNIDFMRCLPLALESWMNKWIPICMTVNGEWLKGCRKNTVCLMLRSSLSEL